MQRSLQSGSSKPVTDRAGVNARLTAAATAEHDSSIATEEQQQQQLIRSAPAPATVRAAACTTQRMLRSEECGSTPSVPTVLRSLNSGKGLPAQPVHLQWLLLQASLSPAALLGTHSMCIAGSKTTI